MLGEVTHPPSWISAAIYSATPSDRPQVPKGKPGAGRQATDQRGHY